ncbi:MAG: hypothetical protein HRF49_01470 [bacterium]|jgi:hypothetical protein
MTDKFASPLMRGTLEVARGFVGVREEPPGSNWGKEIERFLASTGIRTPAPWCAAFVYFCVKSAATELRVENPFAKIKLKAYTPAWLEWADAHGEKLTGGKAAALSPAEFAREIPPGTIFLLYYPKLKRVGHIGFIAGAPDESGYIPTIEGNTDLRGSRTGGGVILRTRRLRGIYRLVRY